MSQPTGWSEAEIMKSEDKIGDSGRLWEDFNHRVTPLKTRFPTEWIIRTLAGANYPSLKLDKSKYAGARILDLGAGDGRNLPLLRALGFKICATEISSGLVEELRALVATEDWEVDMAVGNNNAIPFPDQHFSYLLSSSSCYYLEKDGSWEKVLAELARVVSPGGILFANLPDRSNSLLKGGQELPDGSVFIREDPFQLRNGLRFMTAQSPDHIGKLLQPFFTPLAIGHLDDDYYGLKVSCYIFAAERNS